MKKNKLIEHGLSAFLMGCLLLGCTTTSSTDEDQQKVDNIVASMTLKEKAQLIIGTV